MPDIERKTISASQAAALFDQSPYLTRWMLYRFLAGDDIDVRREDGRMDWGKRMEPLLLQAGAEDLKLEVVPDQMFTRRGLLGCTRDACVIDPQRGPGAFETKVCFDYRVWMQRWSGGQSPPVDLEIQLQTQMYVGDGETPFKWGVIGVWLAGEMHYFEREPQIELWADLEAAAKTLLTAVQIGNEPDPFGSPIELPLLARLYPKVTTETLDLSTDPDAVELAEAAQQYRWAREQRGFFGKLEEQLKSKLVGVAKDHGRLALPEGVFVSIKKSELKVQTIQRRASVTTRIDVWNAEAGEPVETPSSVLGI
jgi:hypothetical protein